MVTTGVWREFFETTWSTTIPYGQQPSLLNCLCWCYCNMHD